MNRWFFLLLHTGSLVFLAMGWFLDLLTIRITISLPLIGDMDIMNETRSVSGTLQNLWETGNYFPFSLIFLFGIVIPLIKTFLIYRVIIQPNQTGIIRLLINNISKWAMADVFAVSILVSFLAANALDYTRAYFGDGFYYFTVYALVSNGIVMFLPKAAPARTMQ